MLSYQYSNLIQFKLFYIYQKTEKGKPGKTDLPFRKTFILSQIADLFFVYGWLSFWPFLPRGYFIEKMGRPTVNRVIFIRG